MMRSEFFLLKNSWIVREKGVVFKKLLNYAYVGSKSTNLGYWLPSNIMKENK